MRQTRYQQIAAELRAQLEAGELGASDHGANEHGERLLPSEAELSARFSASRVTVRRALEVLRDEGLVGSRQGFGWFVATDPLRQSLGRLGTIEGQLARAGVSSTRRVLDFRLIKAPPRVAEVLGSGTVLRVRRLNLADGEPFALITVWCPERLAGDLTRADVERQPFYELVGVPLGSAVQVIGAASATASDAELLGVPEGSPVLRCERVTRGLDDQPLLVSEHTFPGSLTEFAVELPYAEASMAPSGLRLVE